MEWVMLIAGLVMLLACLELGMELQGTITNLSFKARLRLFIGPIAMSIPIAGQLVLEKDIRLRMHIGRRMVIKRLHRLLTDARPAKRFLIDHNAFIGYVLKGNRWRTLSLTAQLGLGDAATTALCVGTLQTLAGLIKPPAAIAVTPCFDGARLYLNANICGGIRLYRLIFAFIAALKKKGARLCRHIPSKTSSPPHLKTSAA
nr:DUF2953 domain-containing protein [bacterium]